MNRNLGADPVQLEELGRNFDLGATSLAEIGNRVAHQFGQAAWFGPDAEQVRYDWDSYYHGRCHSLADMLREVAQLLWRQAEQQRRTSTDLGASGGNAPSGLSGGRQEDYAFVRTMLFGLDLGGLAHDIAGLHEHISKFPDLAKHLPADLLKVTKWMGPIGDLGQLALGVYTGDWEEIAFAALGLGLAGVALGAAAVGMPFVAGAAVVMGIGLTVYEIGKDLYSAAPALIELGGQGVELVSELVGPAVSAIAAPIAAGFEAGAQMVTDVAAPIVDGVADFAGDAWNTGAAALDWINPF